MVIRISSCSPILLARPPLTILVAARDFRNPLRSNNKFCRQFKSGSGANPRAQVIALIWSKRKGYLLAISRKKKRARVKNSRETATNFPNLSFHVDFIFHPSQFRFGQREICLYSFLCASLTAWTSYSVATGEISIENTLCTFYEWSLKQCGNPE